MPLDGHSFLVSQGWSGHGTGLRQDSIIRPLAIPQKRTLTGLGKDRDEAFPFWDHVFSVAAKSIQVKLYKDDDDSSDADATPTQASLDLTTTGILSNKPPKLGSSATATTASSSSNSGSNTPTMTTIHNSVISSSSNLLVAAKKESAKRRLYSRFFRGPILGPDSDSSDSCPDDPFGSDSNAKLKTRTGDDDSGWNSNFNGGAKSGGRTPMAIAKFKLTSASEAVIHLKEGPEKVKEEQKKAKKRKRCDEDEVEVKRHETEEEEDREKKEKKEKKKKKQEREKKQDKKEKKKRKRDEKESLKEEEKKEKKSKKDKMPKAPVADNTSSLEGTRSNKNQKRTVEPNEASIILDKCKSIPCNEDEELHNHRSENKSEKGKDDRYDTSGDKEKRRRERKQKRERKEAEKAAAVVPQVISADSERLNDSNTRSIYSQAEDREEFRSESKKKKRKRNE